MKAGFRGVRKKSGPSMLEKKQGIGLGMAETCVLCRGRGCLPLSASCVCFFWLCGMVGDGWVYQIKLKKI
jgi:hypothetical protein